MTPARPDTPARTPAGSVGPAPSVPTIRPHTPVRLAVAVVFAAHGLIHLIGFVGAVGSIDLPGLTDPIPPVPGPTWLAAALLCWTAAGALYLTPRWWWLPGALAVVVSQTAIVLAWSDAKVGTAANAVLLLAVLYGFASRGPWSLRAEFERAVAASRSGPPEGTVTEADLAPLPDPVRRYLRHAGVVGQPRVHNFAATFSGRIRSAPDADWMGFTAEQFNTVNPPQRYFRMKGLPVDVLHVFDERGATMRVRLMSAYSMVNAKGTELTRAETVTMFNDLCVLAPGALIGLPITWDPVDTVTAVAHFTLGPNTVSAELRFDPDGCLVDFLSDDRASTSPDGHTLTPLRWSTPLSQYAQFGPARAARTAEVKWHPPTGVWTYGEFALRSLDHNVPHPGCHGRLVDGDPTCPREPVDVL